MGLHSISSIDPSNDKPLLTEAFSQALTLYSQDADLAVACEPLVRFFETLTPNWRCGLFQFWNLGRGGYKTSMVCGPSVTGAEGQVVCAAVGREAAAHAPHELVFETLDRPDMQDVRIARLLISDDHAVGALVLFPGGVEPAEPRPDPVTAAATARLLALMLEDRLSIQSLLQREALLSAILDTAPDPIVHMSADGVIRSFNRAAERVFGYGAQEAVGQPVTMLMTENHTQRHQGYVNRYLKTHERHLDNWRRRFPARCKNGVELTVELAISDVMLDGAPHFIGVIRDVTERLREEERQTRLTETLRHAAQLSALGEMAATIAHEVNQPLTAISNFLDAAQALVADPDRMDREKLAEYLRYAREQAQAGGDIVKRVRRLTMRQPPQREMMNINDAVRDVVTHLQRTAKARQAAIVCRLAEPSPVAFADRIQVQQVIANLVSNAINAVADRDERRVEVETAAVEDGGEVLVNDTGPGVAPDRRQAIFDSFYTTRKEGVGLGLSISRSIVETHGGRLAVEDAASGGACFRLFLPARAS